MATTWNDLTPDEQLLVRRMMKGQRTDQAGAGAVRLKERGLAEHRPGGLALNERGKQLYWTAQARGF